MLKEHAIKTFLVTVFSLCLFLSGCASRGELPHTSDTKTTLTKGNFRVIKTSARGTDTGFRLLCFLPVLSPTFADAMENLHSKVQMRGKATSLVNITQDKSELFLLLFSVPKITITADVIEFTD
jgi:hypothetical protein